LTPDFGWDIDLVKGVGVAQMAGRGARRGKRFFICKFLGRGVILGKNFIVANFGINLTYFIGVFFSNLIYFIVFFFPFKFSFLGGEYLT